MRTVNVLWLLIALATPTVAGEIPERPEQLTFPELAYELPNADELRFELANGTPVYALPDRQLPLVHLVVYFRGGGYLEPDGKEGLAAIAGDAWRTGGAGDRSARELDEELDFLAADLSTDIDQVIGSVTLDVLSKDLAAAMGLMMDVLTEPRFQEDRFEKARLDLIQDMRMRNDSTATIEEREWNRLIYGDDYWLNRLPTSASVDSITVDDCRRFVTSLVRAGNVVVAVSGDIEREAIREMLEATIGTLPKLERALPKVPQPSHRPEPGVYIIDKEDVNQGTVRLGHLGYRMGDPDEFALRALNHILGGGGFTSRIMKRVRSDEGLAYDAYSMMSFPSTSPGVFAAGFQSKSSTCAYATEITRGLIEDIREQPVTAEELSTTVNYYVQVFPRYFESAAATVSVFALDEVLDRPKGYWRSFRSNMSSLTLADLESAAERRLHPEESIILVVGNVEDILAGHPDHDARFTDFGKIHHLPLRDPMTLAPIEERHAPE
jgi:zinc protease